MHTSLAILRMSLESVGRNHFLEQAFCKTACVSYYLNIIGMTSMLCQNNKLKKNYIAVIIC